MKGLEMLYKILLVTLLTLLSTCDALFASFVPFAIFFAAIDAWTPPCPSITLHHFPRLMRSLHRPNINEIYYQ